MLSSFNKLPSECYHVMESSGDIIRLVRGISGYYPTFITVGDKVQSQSLVDDYNKKLGVTKAQAEAMYIGSLFGWNVPGADPDNYDENGMPRK